MKFVNKWVELENTMREGTQTQKEPHILSHLQDSLQVFRCECVSLINCWIQDSRGPFKKKNTREGNCRLQVIWRGKYLGFN